MNGNKQSSTIIKTKPRVEKNRCLVTGGAGFVGSHLCEYLVNRGDHVRTTLLCSLYTVYAVVLQKKKAYQIQKLPIIAMLLFVGMLFNIPIIIKYLKFFSLRSSAPPSLVLLTVPTFKFFKLFLLLKLEQAALPLYVAYVFSKVS